MRKRWLLPAVYLAVAAGLLSAVFFMQNGEEQAELEQTPSEEPGQATEDPGVPVTIAGESVHMPVEDEANYDRVGVFFDSQADESEQAEALVLFDNVYRENKGIDLASKDQEVFPVVAAMSGTVTKAMKDSALGFVVEIDHGGDLKTHYSSLSAIDVQQGAEIEQGDVLGEAGSNTYNEEAGVHVHFEIRQDGVAMNPNDAFGKTSEDLLADFPLGEDKDKEENEKPENEKKTENEKPAEGSDKEDKDADENEKPSSDQVDLPGLE